MKRLTTFVRLLVGVPFLILGFVIVGPLLLSGCAKPAPVLTIPVPQSLREACPKADPEPVKTVGDLAAYSIQQEANLMICEARKDSAIAIIDAHADATQQPKRPWWKVWP